MTVSEGVCVGCGGVSALHAAWVSPMQGCMQGCLATGYALLDVCIGQ